MFSYTIKRIFSLKSFSLSYKFEQLSTKRLNTLESIEYFINVYNNLFKIHIEKNLPKLMILERNALKVK